MRPRFHLQRRPLPLASFGSTVLLAAPPVFAQKPNKNPPAKQTNKNPPAKQTNKNPPAQQTEEDPPAKQTNKNPPAQQTEEDPPAQNTAKKTDNADPAPTNSDDAQPTNSDDAQPTNSQQTDDPPEDTATESDPATTGEPTETESDDTATMTSTEPESTATGDSSTDAGLTDPPTLTRGFGIPSYPPASVPPTDHAPFMRHSQAPDGTVFIAVGAILGALALALLLWRVIVSLLLHRSVKRATMAQQDGTGKAGFPAPPAPFYKYTDDNSNMSLNGGAAAAGRGVRRTTRGPTPSSNPSQSNLFFSPTAAASGNAGNRGSSYLPSGFYAAGAGGAGSPGAGHGHSISLTNLRPDSRGHGAPRNTLGPTPPDSPSFGARRDMSTSSVNLNHPSGQRAPSAYLDDLLADDPGALPPPHMPASTGSRNSANLGPGSNRL